MKRNKFSKEFKVKVALEALKGNKTISVIFTSMLVIVPMFIHEALLSPFYWFYMGCLFACNVNFRKGWYLNWGKVKNRRETIAT